MQDQLELQLGRVEAINADGTITIRDFRTGGTIYNNVDIEHTAANQYQPVVGEHVTFFTMGTPLSSRQAKIIRFYGSNRADQTLVRSSPTDLRPGEQRIVSQTGNMVYVANGVVYLGGAGQSITLSDNPGITQISTDNIQVVVNDGTLIHAQNGTLSISKGDLNLQDDGVTMTVANPTLTINITGDNVSVDGTSVTVETNVKEVKLNGTIPVARKGDTAVSSSTQDNAFWIWIQGFVNVFSTWVVLPGDGGAALKTAMALYIASNPPPRSLTSEITEGSSKVKSG